jgi:hypothetical protein
MKDPVRLLDGDATDVERALLRAGAAEEPPPEGALRLAAALGISSALLQASKAAASASTPPAATGAATPWVAHVAAKWLALAGGSIALAAAVLVMRGGPARDADRDTRPAQRVQNATPQDTRPQAASEGPAEAAEPAAPQPARPPRPEAGRARGKSIAREIEQHDAARDRLQRGQARAALAVLDAYRREHAQGVLGQEAALLRIEALSRAGDRDAARRLAERFLRDNPRSPHEGRIRALVGDADAP